MKLMFLAYLHGFGGAEKMIVALANNMHKRGHAVTLVTISDNKQCYTLNEGIKTININDIYINKIVNVLNRLSVVTKIIYKNKPNIVINFWLQPLYLSVLSKLFCDVKLIYSERGDPSDKEYGRLLRFIRYFSFCFTDGFVFQSNAARSYFSDELYRKSCIIRNPVKILGNTNKEYLKRTNRVINVGRLHKQKNQELLIKAFAEFSKIHANYILEIYGDGKLKDYLVKLTEDLNIAEKVSFLNAVSNIHEKIYDAKMFVLSSDYEGMPNSLLECMALGIPCISTNYSIGGVEDIIDNYNNGIIVERNNLQQLVSAMIYVAESDERAEQMGNKAKAIKNLHDESKIFDCWERFFIERLIK